ncbi:MAG: VCBS repeat-containing protein [Bacteroidetes bacterium]|nr:VCBS repeat-containing protein [Bacteroidota bacterium]
MRGHFGSAVDFITGNERNMQICTGDFDGDGRQDLAFLRYPIQMLTVMRNISSSGNLAFGAPQDIGTVGSGYEPCLVGDIDGDGKADIIANGAQTLFRNISTGTNIDFQRINFAGVGQGNCALQDMDLDGRPDIIFADAASNFVSISRNTGVPGSISFANPSTFFTGQGAYYVSVADMNGDSKPDMAVANQIEGTISILKNMSTTGNLQFVLQTNIQAAANGQGLNSIALGDYNQDGKPDLLAGVMNNGKMRFYQNNSSSELSFFETQLFSDVLSTYQFIPYDINGDSRLDAVLARSNSSPELPGFALLRSIFTGVGPVFASPVFFKSGIYGLRNAIVADLNMDGRPDVATVNATDPVISISLNQIGIAAPEILCGNGNTVLTVANSGTIFQWQQNTGAGFFNISDNANFTGTQTPSLQLSSIPSAWYGYQYRCLINGLPSAPQKLVFATFWTGAVNNNWNNPGNWNCGEVPDTNTDVFINCGIVDVTDTVSCRSLTIRPTAIVNCERAIIITR